MKDEDRNQGEKGTKGGLEEKEVGKGEDKEKQRKLKMADTRL
jgi:hypothetical protein